MKPQLVDVEIPASRSTWVSRIRRDPRVSHSAFRLSYLLAQDAGPGNVLSQKIVDLSGRAGTDAGTMIKGLRQLASFGYLTFERAGAGLPCSIALQLSERTQRDVRLQKA